MNQKFWVILPKISICCVVLLCYTQSIICMQVVYVLWSLFMFCGHAQLIFCAMVQPESLPWLFQLETMFLKWCNRKGLLCSFVTVQLIPEEAKQQHCFFLQIPHMLTRVLFFPKGAIIGSSNVTIIDDKLKRINHKQVIISNSSIMIKYKIRYECLLQNFLYQ